jgi:hypothetical protein
MTDASADRVDDLWERAAALRSEAEACTLPMRRAVLIEGAERWEALAQRLGSTIRATNRRADEAAARKTEMAEVTGHLLGRLGLSNV